MAKTLADLKTDVLRRLGDSTSQIWKPAEIARYLNEGYELLAIRTGLLWDTIVLEDQSYAGNFTTSWETAYFAAGWQILNLFAYTADWEAEYVFSGQLALGPANHTTLWEYDNNYHPKSFFLAVHQLPAEIIEIERAVWNKRRIVPLRSTELEFADGQYQTQQGEVLGYLWDKDGIRSFRKWRVPSKAADEYAIIGDAYAGNYVTSWEPDYFPAKWKALNRFAYNQGWEKEYAPTAQQSLAPSNHSALWEFTNTTQFGLLRIPADISGETVIGTGGIARRVPGEHPSAGDGMRGFPRRVWKPANNTRIEYTKKGKFLAADKAEFEIPDLYVKYIRHFAMYRALAREGEGQDLRLALFWKHLWDAGSFRAIKRKQAVNKMRKHVLGGDTLQRGRPPLARLPWQYGKVMR